MKVITRKIANGSARAMTSKDTATKVKRTRDSDGKLITRRVIELSSVSIDRDMTYVFGRNIAKARVENKKVIGSADGRTAKR